MEVSGKRNDTAEEEISEELEKLCELCEADHVKAEANGVCRECEEFMCSTCFRHHLKAKLCRHHVLVDINKSSTLIQRSAGNLEKCQRHANETIKYFCRKHKTVGCGDCMIPEHFDCKPESIKDLSKNYEQHEDFKNIKTKIEDLMSANSAIDEKIQESKKENKRMLEEALKTIQKFRLQVNQYIDKAEENIIEEVKEIERNNDKILAKLEQDCKLLSYEITKVRQKVDTELYKESALFIQSIKCKPKIIDIERTCSKIKTDNEITTFEFIPDKQLLGIITSIEKLGKLTRFKSSAKPETRTQIIQASKDAVTEQRDKPIESEMGKAEKEGPAVDNIYVGARVRVTSRLHRRLHCDQPGTVTAVHPDGKVDVKWDASGITGRRYILGENGHVKLI